jgi:DNA mismatch repair ATPase MutL
MANENPTNTQKPQAETTKTMGNAATTRRKAQATGTAKGSKRNRSQIGGTAVPGARSTQPKQVSQSNNPKQQQIDSYNRTMRRRMEHIGAGPYAQEQHLEKLRNKRQKRVEQMKERRVEAQQELKQSMRGFGRRNLYFFIATVAIVIVLIILFVVLRQLHVLG